MIGGVRAALGHIQERLRKEFKTAIDTLHDEFKTATSKLMKF